MKATEVGISYIFLFLESAGLLSDGEKMTMSSFLAVYSVVAIDRSAEALGH